jgi:hypothetical protein
LKKLLQYQQMTPIQTLVVRKEKGRNTSSSWIGIGCPAHVGHSAVQTAADRLSIDLQLIINKIYQHFHIYYVRVEELKSFCEFTET